MSTSVKVPNLEKMKVPELDAFLAESLNKLELPEPIRSKIYTYVKLLQTHKELRKLYDATHDLPYAKVVIGSGIAASAREYGERADNVKKGIPKEYRW